MTHRRHAIAALFVIALTVAWSPVVASAQSIAAEGDHFVVDRGDGSGPHAKFLTFISYFDALRATDRDGDLDYIANTLHLDGIRVLPNWERRTSAYCADPSTDTLFDANGNVRGDVSPATGPLKALMDLLDAAAARKLIVDVTFTRETVPNLSIDDYVKAVTRATVLLIGRRNALFDLQNEWEVGNKLSAADVGRLRTAVHDVDPSRVVVASTSSGTAQQLSVVASASLSAAAYHGDRESGWETRIAADVTALRGSHRPVYLQEPQAWDSGLTICGSAEPSPKDADGTAAHFRTAVSSARTAGAAAWTFHTRQSFKLDGTATLKSQIQTNADEKALLEGTPTTASLSATAATGTWGISAVLTLDLQGTGDGSVTSSPAGINCGVGGTSCSATFPPGTSVTLTATSPAGSEFTGWDACGGTGSCTLTVDTLRTVTARFQAVQQIYYYDQDAIGSTRLITDSHGAVVERHDYTPFGVEVTPSTGFTPRLFAGKQRDTETGLDESGARYFLSAVGRFTTPDAVVAIKKGIANPQRWSRYAYALNNPLRYVDTDGRCAVPAGLGAGQVGICIESFIAARRIGGIGFGDDRTFAANDPDATFRTSLRLVLDDRTGAVLSQSATAGISEVGLTNPLLGLPGRMSLAGASAENADGSHELSLYMTGRNGFSFANTFGDIAMSITLNVKTDGSVTLGKDSATKLFPSYEAYAYRVIDGQLQIQPLFKVSEQSTSALNGPLFLIVR